MPSNQGQITIRELMILVLFFAAGLGGLSTGGLLASIVIGFAAILTTAIAIVAFVGHQEMRAPAIGFLVPVVAYAASIMSVGSTEFDPYQGQMPTTKLLQPVHRLLVKTTWMNMSTGKIVADYNPAKDPSSGGGGLGGLGGMGGMMSLIETPDRKTFMSLAHVLLATILGYAGAKFAVYVHRKAPPGARTGDEQSDPPKSPVTREFES